MTQFHPRLDAHPRIGEPIEGAERPSYAAAFTDLPAPHHFRLHTLLFYPMTSESPPPPSPKPDDAGLTPSGQGQVHPLLEVIGVFLIACATTAGISYGGYWIEGYGQLLLGLAFLLGAVKLAEREPGGLTRFGIDLQGLLVPTPVDDNRSPGPLALFDLARAIRDAWRGLLRECAYGLAACACVFPPFVALFWVWHFWWLGYPDHGFQLNFSSELWTATLTQILVVALPEEAFFRGYVQTRLTDAFPRRRSWFGISLSPTALILASLLFALLHFVSVPDLTRLAVFFPALLFGWIRASRKDIIAAVVFHACCNLFADLLERSWLL